MSGLRGWLLLALLPLGGCTGLVHAANAATATVTWRKDGFVVEDKRREFIYDADENTERLVFDGQVTYIDLDRDGFVDTFSRQLGGNVRGEWTRNEPGTEELFAEADQAFADGRSMLGVEALHEEWSGMSEADKARGHGRGVHER
ncbi:MAG: hypothetical protein ACYTGX_11435 [Planctomycetota bacterium]|jgi:hypothetical protein